MADVGHVDEIRFAPAKGRERVEGGTTDGDKVKRSHELMRGDLAVGGAVRAVTERVKWVSAVGWIQIVSSRDGVLSGIFRLALLTPRKRVVAVIVVPHLNKSPNFEFTACCVIPQPKSK